MFEGTHPERIRESYSIGLRPIVMYTGATNAYQRIDYLLSTTLLELEFLGAI
jgi:hypothetical protein